MSLYFITPKNSKTGKRLADLWRRKIESATAGRAFLGKVGATAAHADYATNKVIALHFSTPPNKENWETVPHGFFPKADTQEGRRLRAEIEAIPVISPREMNACVRYHQEGYESIGANKLKNGFYGFTVGDNWEFTPPADCEEVTKTRYDSIFKEETAEAATPAQS